VFPCLPDIYSDVQAKAVTALDVEKRKITLDDSKDLVSYDKLILAPGGTPRRLPIPGADLENVFTFRDINDATKVDGGT